MAVNAVFDHGDMEHLAGRSAVDVTALGEHLLPPLLSGDPGDDPRFDGRKVRHEEAASRLGDKGGANQFGKHQRDGIVEQLHGVKAPVPHQCPGLFQIGQMVLRKVLHLDEPPGKSAGSVGSVKLDQPTGAVIRTDHRLHGGVFLDAAFGQLLPQGQGQLHLALRMEQKFQYGCFGEGLGFHTLFRQPRFELGGAVGVLQPGDRAGLFQMGALEPLVTTDGLGHQGAVQQNAPVVDALVEMVVLPLLLGDRETGQSLLDGHLRLYIPEVVGFEGGPLLRRVCRKAAKGGAIPGLRRCAEIAHQVFALLEFLLLQAQHGAGPLQREGQTQGSRPHHGAVPGVGVQVLSDRVPQVPGETHPLELCVEGPLGHRRVCQRSQHIGGDAFADGEIHHPDGAAVHGIAEQQHFKLRDLAVAVHAALGQRLRGKGFNIDG